MGGAELDAADGYALLGRLLGATAWTPPAPAPKFEAQVPTGPLGSLKTGRDTFAIIPLRRMAADRDMSLFTIDDRTVNLACCGSAFSGPVYAVRPDDTKAWFQGTLMLITRWLDTTDEFGPWLESLGRIGNREGLEPYMRKFIANEYLPALPAELHDDPTTMSLLKAVATRGGIDPSAVELAGRPLSEHAPFCAAE